jgi:adenylate kinase family enzyme
MRVLVLGNSGSGKSHLARALAARHGLAHLDLDTIVWEPGQIAVARAAQDVWRDLRAFFDAHPAWVAEGAYGDLVEQALPYCTELVFLNPGKDACLLNNARRPWEPHKYASMAAQQSMLPMLTDWVAQYYERDDACSYAWHRRVFDAWQGNKREFLALQD